MKLNPFLVILLAMLCVETEAGTFFVSPDGSNRGAGTEVDPWPSLNFALNDKRLAPGDVIQLTPGVHAGSAKTAVSGTADAVITIQGSGLGVTVLSGKLTVEDSFYTIRDLTIDGGLDGARSPGGYLNLRGMGCHDVVVENCEFMRGVSGVSFQGPSGDLASNCRITKSVFHHPVGNGMLTLSGSGHTVDKCVFRDNAGFDVIRVYGADHSITDNKFLRIHAPGTDELNASSKSLILASVGTKRFTVKKDLQFTEYDQVTITSSSNPWLRMTGFVSSLDRGLLVVDVREVKGFGFGDDWDIVLGAETINGNHADIIQTFASSTLQPTSGIVFSRNYIEDCSAQWGNLENDASNTLNGDWLLSENVFNRSRITLNCYIPDVKVVGNTFFDTSGNSIGLRGASSGGLKGAAHRMRITHNYFIRIAGNSYGNGAYAFNSDLEGCFDDYNVLTSLSDGPFARFSSKFGTHNINGGVTPEEIFLDVAKGDFTRKTDGGQSNQGTLNDDVVLVYNLGWYDPKAPMANDLGPNKLDAMMSRIAETVSGVLGDALENTSGNKGSLIVPYNPVFDFTSFTVATWVNPTEAPDGVVYIAGMSGKAGERRWKLSVNPNLSVSLTKYLDGVRTAGTVTSSDILSIDSWNLVVATFDDEQNLLAIQIGNSRALGEPKVVKNSTNIFSSGSCTLGIFRLPGSSGNFVGKIDAFTIWSRALQTKDISDLWNFGLGKDYPY